MLSPLKLDRYLWEAACDLSKSKAILPNECKPYFHGNIVSIKEGKIFLLSGNLFDQQATYGENPMDNSTLCFLIGLQISF